MKWQGVELDQWLGVEVDQYDTHFHGNIFSCKLNNRIITDKILVKVQTSMPSEILCFLIIADIININTIKILPDFEGIVSFKNQLIKPTRLKIGGHYKKDIVRYKKGYNFIIEIIHIDEVNAKIQLSTIGCWTYDWGEIIISKDLLGKIIHNVEPVVIFPKKYFELESKIEKMYSNVKNSKIMTKYKETTLNTFDMMLKSSVRLSYSNILKMLVPTIEGILIEFINIKNIKNIKCSSLGSIVGSLEKYNGSEISKELKEYLKILVEPIRNLTLHGGIPSENVCCLLTSIILEIFQELIEKEKIT